MNSCLKWPVCLTYSDQNVFHFRFYLENSGCFLMTSLSVARTAAMVSSDVPWSCCWLPEGSFWTRSLIAYLPENWGSRCEVHLRFKIDTLATCSCWARIAFYYCKKTISLVQILHFWPTLNFARIGSNNRKSGTLWANSRRRIIAIGVYVSIWQLW